MLLDNEIAAYLREEPLASEVARYDTMIFSPNKMNAMMEYLHGIEAAASREHLARVREVYGPRWGGTLRDRLPQRLGNDGIREVGQVVSAG